MNNSQVERLIDELPEGYATYLKIATDPYHDRTIRFEGAPTSRNATSVCLCLNQEQTYTAEDFGIDFATTPSWDAHFAMYPFLQPHGMSYAQRLPNLVTNTFLTGTQAAGQIYPLTVHGVPSGTPTYCSAGLTPPLTVLGLSNSSLISYISNPIATDNIGLRTLRIVGESFEVIDESPEIYQQGAVTVYRYPLDTTLSKAQFTYPGVIIPTTYNPSFGADILTPPPYLSEGLLLYQLKAPPSNTSSAVLVSGSETWKAKDGCYVIGTQYQSEVPFKQCDNTKFMFTACVPASSPNFVDGYYDLIDNSILSQGWAQGSALNATDTVQTFPDICSPFNLSGAYFTGLSSQYGTLRLRYKVFVEILTDPSDTTLIPLASKTLPYSQPLQELVMDVISRMPSGIPQYMNAGGINWKNVLKSVGSAAEKLSGPLSSLSPEVGLILQGGGRLAQQIARRPSKKKEKNKSAQQRQTQIKDAKPQARSKPASVPSKS